jgi:hypothetical protein
MSAFLRKLIIFHFGIGQIEEERIKDGVEPKQRKILLIIVG